MKKHNVFVGMSGGFGPLSQVLPIIETFDKDKFDITCYIASSSAEMVKSLGYKFCEAPKVNAPKVLLPKGRKWCDIDHYWGRFGYIDREYVNEMIPAKVKLIENCNPDFIVSQFSPPTEIAAKILNVPLISITQSCMHPNGKNVSWWENSKENYPKAAPIISELMKKYGLKPIERMEELNRGDLTIVPSFPEFDPINDEVFYTGPLIWSSIQKKNQSEKRRDKWKKGRPLIFVYTGNLYDSSGAAGIIILQNVIDAFGNSDLDIVVSTGLGQSLSEVGEIPSNIRILDWVPGHEIIRECDLTIHHGGHGSCMLNISGGVPSVVVPTFSEREFNARQLKALGVGEVILPSELTADRLYEVVNHCLQDENMVHKAKVLKKEIEKRKYEGGIGAREQIIKFINNNK